MPPPSPPPHPPYIYKSLAPPLSSSLPPPYYYKSPPPRLPGLVQLVIAITLQIFQQFTDINAIMFYAPVLFNTLGFKNDASLYSAVIIGAVNVLSTIVSIYSVDKVGRRMLLLEAGV
ncbi:hypothetical protein K1719_036687 [Acacia pycnantha]|nr:hypothetical protein K1719_036687 [Acacia pycnantha]